MKHKYKAQTGKQILEINIVRVENLTYFGFCPVWLLLLNVANGAGGAGRVGVIVEVNLGTAGESSLISPHGEVDIGRIEKSRGGFFGA